MKYKHEQNIEDDYKIKGLYSYNWLDHPDYINAKKIEKKIVRYKKKLKKNRKALSKDLNKSARSSTPV